MNEGKIEQKEIKGENYIRLSVKRAVPARSDEIIPALETRASVKVDFP